MPRVNSYEGDLSNAPLLVRAAFDVSRAWTDEGRCRHHEGRKIHAWTCTPGEKVALGNGDTVPAEKLIELALAVCFGCPVQWDCASFAIITHADIGTCVGTWGVDIAGLRWMKKQMRDDPEFLERARVAGTPVQVAVAEAHGAKPRPSTAA